ncbi:ATP-binding cassette domain-containing protein [Streptomyces chryseus]|uniref:ATP-binding cassette domain-containing protein n=2 Tax=Streptomyces chryseus TaxID=68186 RepID=UPI0019A24BD1|nr:ATP-binding cassette domain-containing protein [Streptomyces chryseus]GGX45525.1 ABC transporter ATP-binding protein [Streptomyces chryseus]
MGVEICVEGLTKSFGHQVIWQDVSLTLPAGEVSVMLGPSGTGKSVFLKTLVGLLKPERGSIKIAGQDITKLRERDLYEVRKLFGVLFQDGALFGSMSLYDNIAFPLREHTRKPESEVRRIVLEKMDMVGLIGAEDKLPGEISGGMRKRAGLARALVLDPEIILFDEPDSGLDPVRVAYLNQLIVDLNAQIDATFLIVTHDIASARLVPDNIGLLFRRELVMFGPREDLLTSDEPVVRQFLNGRMQGPIGMAEEKDAAQVEQELADLGNGAGQNAGEESTTAMTPRLLPSPGVTRPPRWQAIAEREVETRRKAEPHGEGEPPDQAEPHDQAEPPQKTEPQGEAESPRKKGEEVADA